MNAHSHISFWFALVGFFVTTLPLRASGFLAVRVPPVSTITRQSTLAGVKRGCRRWRHSIATPHSLLFSSPLHDDNEPDDETYIEPVDQNSLSRRNLIINGAAIGLIAASGLASTTLFMTNVYTPPGFKRLPVTQFIAALGDPNAASGPIGSAEQWGLWNQDPGPRGVWLANYEADLVLHDNVAPRGWKFDPNDWWLEEHGLIMEQPKFPVPPGRYLVTGGRATTTGLTIADNGSWKLDDGATLYDVTHLPCRSARYHPVESVAQEEGGGPQRANRADFPVRPGAEMPVVPGCDKQDYAVLFLVGKASL